MGEKYFNYFLKRATIFNEMARPPSVFGKDSGPTQAYGKARAYIKQKYGIDSGTLDRRIFGYMYHIIPDNLISPEEQEAIKTGSKKSTALFKSAVGDMVKRLISTGKMNVDKFVKNLTDEEKIDNYMQAVTGLAHGSRAKGTENEMQRTVGVGTQDFRQLIAQSEPLRKEINRIMSGRKISRAKMGDLSKYNAPVAVQEDLSPDLIYTSNIISVLEKLIELRHDLDENEYDPEQLDDVSHIISKIPVKELERTYDMYETMLDNKTGTSPEELEKLIGKFSSNPKVPKTYIQFLNLLKSQAEQYESNTDDHSEPSITYDGYDQDVINKVLNSPEKRELFDKWYRLNNKWREQKNAELENRLIQQIIDDNFFSKRDMEDNVDDKHLSPQIIQLGNQRKEFIKKLEQANEIGDSVAAAKLEYFIQQLSKTIEHLQKGGGSADTGEEEEGDVMNYMSSQVRSDQHKPNPNRKFVDRGFKKPRNHWEYLQNQ